MLLPVYVINLDRRPERWQVISENLERIGLEAQRIPAVDADLLIKELGQTGKKNGPKLNLGAAACMLSHSKALQKLLDSSHLAALVLEDDAEIASDTPLILNSTDWWPTGAGIIRLEDGKHRRRPLRASCGQTPDGRDLRKIEYWIGGAAGYLISRAAARIALEAFEHSAEQTDHILFDLRVSKTARRLRTVQIVPAMVRQRRDCFKSDLAPWEAAAKPRGWKKHLLSLMKSIRSMPYKIKFLGLLLSREIHRIPIKYVDSLKMKYDINI